MSLPVLVSVFACFDLLQTQTVLSDLVSELSMNSALKPFRLSTGDQLWVVSEIDALDRRDVLALEENGSLQEALNVHHNRLDDLIQEAERQVRGLLGERCQHNCGALYRIELRLATAQLDDVTGQALRLQCAERQARCQMGSYQDSEQNGRSQHRFLRVRGSLNRNSTSFRESMAAFALAPGVAQAYATLSGITGSTSLQHYGSSDFRGDHTGAGVMPYVTFVGLRIELDLGDGITGNFLSAIRSVLGRSGDRVLSAQSISIPRKEI